MRVLFINTVIKDGSTGNIMFNLQEKFRQYGHDTLFFYGRESHSEIRRARKITPAVELYINVLFTRLFGLNSVKAPISSIKLKRYIKQFNPDAVVLGNLHGYYINENYLFKLLKVFNIPVYYYMFDEYAYHGKCTYAGDCKKYKNGCGDCPKLGDYPKTFYDCSKAMFSDKKRNYSSLDSLFFISTPQNCRRALDSPIFSEKEKNVLSCAWGIDVKSVYKPTDPSDVIKELGIDTQKPIVLSINPLSDLRKNVKEVFFKAANVCKNSQIQFVHVGNDEPEAEIPGNCISLPYIADQEKLSKICTLADAFIMTSKEDTYPTVCLISQACGTPIIGFNSSGIPDTACPETAKLFPADDLDSLISYVKTIDKKTDEASRKCREYALENFDFETKAIDLIKRMEEEVQHAKSCYNRG
ncbi:MAG: glycosyltransferase [Clostridia bacterium]|nr:glycosyltransferase [Clostridia bacterium]